MLKTATVYFRDIPVGLLAQSQEHYLFRYARQYRSEKTLPPIAITLPKRNKTFRSIHFFPFFFGLLTEGVQKEEQCFLMKIDEHDYFTRLVKTSRYGSIGAISVTERKQR